MTNAALYRKAKKLIPGGTQLLSKRPEMFLPTGWPAYYLEAKGFKVTTWDGEELRDFSTMGIGACILGYADSQVDSAVISAVRRGSMSSLNCPEEVELAELLCSLHPWADMARFCRSGGEAMAMAVRIARARTRRDKVAFCGYHGWHDWYLSANLSDDAALDGHLLSGLDPLGVPRALRGSSIPFAFNDVEGLSRIVNENELAAIVLEPVRNAEPSTEFLGVLEYARSRGILVVVDEITSGWRLNCGGAHLVYGIKPDIAVFAKAIANGYPMAAVIGRGDVMQAAQDTFISSTFWTERTGPMAALATIRKMAGSDHQVLTVYGELVRSAWESASSLTGMGIKVSGISPLSHFSFIDSPLVCKTLFTKYMLEAGYLASTSYYASWAHTGFSAYRAAVLDAFKRVRRNYERYTGETCHEGFQRLN